MKGSIRPGWLYGISFAVVIILWITFSYIVFQSTQFQNYVTSHLSDDFLKKSGPLGDTFGSFSSLMAALAAVGAVLSLREQRQSSKTDVFTSTFTALMDRLQQTVQDTTYYILGSRQDFVVETERVVETRTGQTAFFELAQELRSLLSADYHAEMNSRQASGLLTMTYLSFYEKYKDDLGHYFRQVYHIVLYLDESKEESSVRFLKFLRASFNNSQLLLIAYNVACGEGAIKFADLVEKHSLLHNLGFEKDNLGEIERAFIETRLGAGALRSQTEAIDKEREGYRRRSGLNLRDKDAFREYLLFHNKETDWDIPWRE